MLSIPQKTFAKIKKMLLRQQKEIEQEIRSVEKEDPIKEEQLAQSSEPGTESWLADVHGRAVAIGQNLQHLLVKTRQSLLNLKTGKYGHCEVCGKHIEVKRLEVMPTATRCLSCSKKK
ncbi:TraR/DksA C4-type zinc finger protein [Candidatus Daviesbacteria bacterium]|nr:TraR/DksA C4-type zinc finger protein [Candidatus Daviesbacteria bacterium]